MAEITKEQIDNFLSGSNPMERIVKIECGYNDDKVYVIYNDENGVKRFQKDSFYPFLWTKTNAARELFNGDRKELKRQMSIYNIGVKALRTSSADGYIPQRMNDGYNLMFYAKTSMTYSRFMDFFANSGVPIYPEKKDKNYGRRDYIVVSPVEQYMIYTGKRMFKGYNDYDELTRVEYDLETEGLDPETCMISQIGVRTNKGFEKVISIDGEGDEKFKNEIIGLEDFFTTLKGLNFDVLTGHNIENFDNNFIDVRLQKHGSSLKDFSLKIFPRGIYKKKKQSVLKLGGEMEYFYPTIMWGRNITDSLFAVRRAQALDSNMKRADLKYVTRYSNLNKENRVYVPGKIINTTWLDETKSYAFNDKDGEWFKITDKHFSKTLDDGTPMYEKIDEGDSQYFINKKKNIKYEVVTGRYIVQRYLLDDLYETDKVELRYNQPNFLVGKMLPVQFDKMCTMGTAAIWKYIMLAWSFENNLAVPELISRRKFTGGLSRLLSVGYIDRVVKLDYNSLYPSIMLSMGIESKIDVMGVMLSLLEYILTQREHYKALKGKAGKQAKKLKAKISDFDGSQEDLESLVSEFHKFEEEESRNDKMQLPLKITGNAFFGSYGSGSVFPWSDIECAEETTCSGRMMLRLMIYWFTNLGYKPIVGDSFTGDTPLFIKYNDSDLIDIKPISEMIDTNNISIDELGREYDTSKKGYKVLCRSGWVEPSYIYRHKTDKDIYRVTDGECSVDVTEDHSLFDSDKNEIKPTDIKDDTELEYYNDIISEKEMKVSKSDIDNIILQIKEKNIDRIPVSLLNADKIKKYYFCCELINNHLENENYTKTIAAGIQYIKNCICSKKTF